MQHDERDPNRGDRPWAETPAPDEVGQLERLARLRRDGVLTDDEFETQKQAILGGGKRTRRPRRPRSRRTKVLLTGMLAILVLGAVGGGVAAKVHHDNVAEAAARADAKAAADKRERDRERAEQARQAEEEAQLAAEQKRAEDKLEVSMRRLIVKDLRKSVTEDFEGRVSDGILDGPILSTSCDPVGGGLRDLGVNTGKFECLVATEDLGDGRVRGYPVDATVNFKKGSYTWQMSS